jgi:hypothetical protein
VQRNSSPAGASPTRAVTLGLLPIKNHTSYLFKSTRGLSGLWHIYLDGEWLKVLWLDEVTFLVKGRTVKAKVRGGHLNMDIRVPYSLSTVLAR